MIFLLFLVFSYFYMTSWIPMVFSFMYVTGVLAARRTLQRSFHLCASAIHRRPAESYNCHSSMLAPQDSPAPNPARISFCPFFSVPFLLSSSIRIGILAEEVFPYS